MPLGKLSFFAYVNVSRTKSAPAKKTSEQCFSGETKPKCQSSAIFEHFQKWPKNLEDVLARGLSIMLVAHVPISYVNLD